MSEAAKSVSSTKVTDAYAVAFEPAIIGYCYLLLQLQQNGQRNSHSCFVVDAIIQSTAVVVIATNRY